MILTPETAAQRVRRALELAANPDIPILAIRQDPNCLIDEVADWARGYGTKPVNPWFFEFFEAARYLDIAHKKARSGDRAAAVEALSEAVEILKDVPNP